jgi:hypothetical protein
VIVNPEAIPAALTRVTEYLALLGWEPVKRAEKKSA